ncbi:MAG: hypothetical protein LBQ02_04135 [Candidatus Nomurabacteria bacterium]|nr:hypothetical protein [Candidatus Nomurabacteria bacterium]
MAPDNQNQNPVGAGTPPPLPPTPLPPAQPTAPVESPQAPQPAPQVAAPVYATPLETPPATAKKSKKGLLIGLIAGGVALLAGVACFLIFVVFAGKDKISCTGSYYTQGIEMKVDYVVSGSGGNAENVDMTMTMDMGSSQAAELVKSTIDSNSMLSAYETMLKNGKVDVETNDTEVIMHMSGESPYSTKNKITEIEEQVKNTFEAMGAQITCE